MDKMRMAASKHGRHRRPQDFVTAASISLYVAMLLIMLALLKVLS
jgi:hypothetical protein